METSTLGELIARQAAAIGERTAFVTPARSWTYAELDAESSRIAQGLLALGVGHGHRVGCLTKHSAECTALLFACAKIGAVCAPYNWRLAAPELEYVINQSEARVLFADRFLGPALNEVSMPNVTRTFIIDAADGPDALSSWRAGFPPTNPGYQGKPTGVVLQLCSSGTTGLPKGVELTHFGLLLSASSGGREMGHSASMVQLNVLPTFHVSGLVGALGSVVEGAMTVSYPEFDPDLVLAAIAEHRVTYMFLVPAMILFLLRAPAIAQSDLSSLTSIAYGGSPISEQLLSEAIQVFGCEFMQVYGATEVSGTLTILSPADHHPSGSRADLLRSAGKPIGGVELRIVEPESLNEQPEGKVGEICARTRTLMKGYWRNKDATKEAFPFGRDSDGFGGWYRTGDAGYMRDGYLYIHDRVKDMVISGGENIYPAEVENVIAKHPAVSEVAVIGVPHEVWGEAVKACVVLRSGAGASETELLEFTRARLAHYKCPKSIDFMAALPRNPSGKLLKRILRERYWGERQRKIA